MKRTLLAALVLLAGTAYATEIILINGSIVEGEITGSTHEGITFTHKTES